jgi:hypothetical protein
VGAAAEGDVFVGAGPGDVEARIGPEDVHLVGETEEVGQAVADEVGRCFAPGDVRADSGP